MRHTRPESAVSARLEAPFTRGTYARVVKTDKGKSMARKYSTSASKNVRRVMKKRKAGTLKSGSGRKVRSRKQAIAIALSESRRAGKKVPKAPTRKSAKKKKATRKTATKKTARKSANKTKTTRKTSTKTRTTHKN